MDINLHITINGSGEVSAAVDAAGRSAATTSTLPDPSMVQLGQGEPGGATSDAAPAPTLSLSQEAGASGSWPPPEPSADFAQGVGDQKTPASSALPNPMILAAQMRAAGNDLRREVPPEPLPEEELKARIAAAEGISADEPGAKMPGRKGKED